MKKTSLFVLLIAVLAFGTSCKKMSYKKTKSGLTYIIFPGTGKDSMIKEDEVVKFEFISKLNDSVMYSSYGKMPGFAKCFKGDVPTYNLIEILPNMRVGDSAVTVQLVDSMIAKGMQQQLPPNAKKGDRLTINFRILDRYKNDSIARAAYELEMEKDRPRQMAERMEMMKKENDKRDSELEKSGEISKEIKEMETYLQNKKIDAQKTGKGTYVSITEQGTGPQAENGKYVKVKYTGRVVETDSTFESGEYPFQLGTGSAIRGWDEGLLLFKQGGKGTLFIPGFLAYGNNPNSMFKPFAALKFDVELLEVSDKPIQTMR